MSKLDDLDNSNNTKYFNKKFRQKLEEYNKFKKNFFDVILKSGSVATSGHFDDTSYESVKKKIDYFKLDNIELIQGDFKKTIPKFFGNKKIKISSCNIDCDLYDSCNLVLPYVYQNLSKQGYILLDEYYSFNYPGARIAVDNFCKKRKIKLENHKVRKSEFERWYITK